MTWERMRPRLRFSPVWYGANCYNPSRSDSKEVEVQPERIPSVEVTQQNSTAIPRKYFSSPHLAICILCDTICDVMTIRETENFKNWIRNLKDRIA